MKHMRFVYTIYLVQQVAQYIPDYPFRVLNYKKCLFQDTTKQIIIKEIMILELIFYNGSFKAKNIIARCNSDRIT